MLIRVFAGRIFPITGYAMLCIVGTEIAYAQAILRFCNLHVPYTVFHMAWLKEPFFVLIFIVCYESQEGTL